MVSGLILFAIGVFLFYRPVGLTLRRPGNTPALAQTSAAIGGEMNQGRNWSEDPLFFLRRY